MRPSQEYDPRTTDGTRCTITAARVRLSLSQYTHSVHPRCSDMLRLVSYICSSERHSSSLRHPRAGAGSVTGRRERGLLSGDREFPATVPHHSQHYLYLYHPLYSALSAHTSSELRGSRAHDHAPFALPTPRSPPPRRSTRRLPRRGPRTRMGGTSCRRPCRTCSGTRPTVAAARAGRRRGSPSP